ncbi:hypothetical protein [Paraburkholderia fungorum]|uniref:hypothetical protein n=1 Tax=Paraburkholderia fungorum TaxID=134537 RepID=UPI0038BBB6C6
MVGKVARVGLVATVLEPTILLDRGGIGQMDHDAGQLEYRTVFFERDERHHRIQPLL